MKKKKTLICILGILIIISTLCCIALYKNGNSKISNNEISNSENEDIDVEEVNSIQPERQLWLENKNINNDYIGELVFDSGLINKSFVQAKSVYDENGNLYHFYTEKGKLVKDGTGYSGNDVYIWTNWKDMSYDYNILGGSVFMDYRNDIDDQNIIIYGHHFSERAGHDPNRDKAFTPLEKLFDEDNYEENSTLKLILDNETRDYELVGVYKYNVNDSFCVDTMQYYRTSYNYDEFEDVLDENYYQNYIDGLKKVSLYDTNVDLTTNDKTLTLQTCVSGQDGVVYEICVFKLTNTQFFE